MDRGSPPDLLYTDTSRSIAKPGNEAAKNLSPDAANLFSAARAYWKEGRQVFESKYVTQLANHAPEQVVASI